MPRKNILRQPARAPRPFRGRVRACLLGLLGSLALGSGTRGAHAEPPASERDPRIDSWVGALTPGEAIDRLSGTGFGTQPLERLGIPAFSMSDGPAGVRSPAPAIAYPSGIALAASWSEALAASVGTELGHDARARGVQFLLGPGVNLYRSPQNGRNFEYFGEDPLLAARIAVGFVLGVQSQRVSATIKHFVGNESEFARRTSNSVIDERTLREMYLVPFEAAVKEAHVGAVMSAYNLTNGQHMTQNGHLVNDVLKREWGFDGVFMSDWGATYDGLAAASGGLDLEMPNGKFMNRANLEPALRDGRLSRDVVDDKLRRLFRVAARFGWLESTAPDRSISRYNQAGRAVARQGVLEGAVLLKNAKNLLPLDASRIRTIAVIGPLTHPGEATGGGSGRVPTHHTVSLLEGLSDALGTSVTVTHASGLPPLRELAMHAAFTTQPNGTENGLTVEEFSDIGMRGAPVATRVEWTLAKGSPAFLGDPDGLQLRDNVPVARMRARREVRQRNEASRRYERWTGYFTPERAGEFTLFVQDGGGYRLWVDGKLRLDSSPLPRATLRQLHLTLDKKPHQVVFEEAPGGEQRQPFFRVGIIRDDAVVDPYALELAKRADVVIAGVGFESDIETESSDREFALPPGQDRLLRELCGVNRNVIAVLTSGGSVDISPWLGDVEGLVAAWFPGQEGGAALADLLLGKANFSGRLPISWERRLEDNPSAQSYFYNDPSAPDAIVYREGLFTGYRGHHRQNTKPTFPFGFGLSYTSFRYAHLRVEPTLASAGKGTPRRPLFQVSFDITNTGARSGADVPQVYVSPAQSPVPRPKRELRAFTRVELAPGETRHVTLPLDARAFTRFDAASPRWLADPGTYGIELARSADAIEAKAELTLKEALSLSVSD